MPCESKIIIAALQEGKGYIAGDDSCALSKVIPSAGVLGLPTGSVLGIKLICTENGRETHET